MVVEDGVRAFGVWGSVYTTTLEYCNPAFDYCNNNRSLKIDYVFANNIELSWKLLDGSKEQLKLAYYLKRDKNNVSFSYTEQFVDSYKYNPGIIAIRWYTNNGWSVELSSLNLHTYIDNIEYFSYSEEFIKIGKYIKLDTFVLGLEYYNLIKNFDTQINNSNIDEIDIGNGSLIITLGTIF